MSSEATWTVETSSQPGYGPPAVHSVEAYDYELGDKGHLTFLGPSLERVAVFAPGWTSAVQKRGD